MNKLRLMLGPLLALGLVIAVSSAFGHTLSLSKRADRERPILRSVGDDRSHAAVSVDGATWRLRTFHNPSGEQCVAHDIAETDVAVGCLAESEMFRHRDLFVTFGGRQRTSETKRTQWDQVWVRGAASPAVASLSLVTANCSVIAIPLSPDRWFMYVVGQAEIVRGAVPYLLTARASDGRILEVKNVLVGPPHNAVEAGLQSPTPGQSCSP
jgi:hypothetical protein